VKNFLRASLFLLCLGALALMPPRLSGAPVEARNYLWNGSFETWVGDIPDGWRVGPVWSDFRSHNLGITFSPDEAQRVHGTRSLRIGTRAENNAALDCPYFALPPGKRFTLSLWLKSDAPSRAITLIFFGRFVGVSGDKVESQLTVGNSWRRYLLTTPPTAPQPFNRFHVGVYFSGKGTLWVDAVQVEEGTQATNWSPHWAETPRAPLSCPFVVQTPEVDGVLSEPLWAGATSVTLSSGSAASSLGLAALRLARTQDAILLAVECPQPRAQVRAPTRAPDANLFGDDRVEFFLSRMAGGRPYYHFVVNGSGSRYEARGRDAAWTAAWESAVKVEQAKWTVEARIPLNALGDAGASLSLAVFRVFGGSGAFQSLGPNKGAFHTPETFTPLVSPQAAATSGKRPRVSSVEAWRMSEGRRLVRLRLVPGQGEARVWRWSLWEAGQSAGAASGTMELGPGQVSDLTVALPASQGEFVRLRWRLESGSASLFGARDWVAVQPFFQASLDKSFYSSEGEALCLARVAPWPRALVLAARLGQQVHQTSLSDETGHLSLDIAGLSPGRHTVQTLILDGETVLAREYLTLVKAAAAPNAVTADYLRRCLTRSQPLVLVMPGWGPRDMLRDAPWPPFNTAMQWRYEPAVAPVYRDARLSPDELRGFQAFLDAAHAAGAGVLFHLPLSGDTGATEAMTATLVSRFKEHPALLGWLLADEPEGRHSPETLAALAGIVKRLDPYHPTWINCAVWIRDAPFHHRKYACLADLFSIDVYPIPQDGPWAVAEWLDRARAAAGPFQPLAVWVQAFGGVEWWRREPTPAEERAMVYAALAKGACGVFFFTYRPRGEALWSEVQRLAEEMRELAPLLAAPWGPKVVPSDSEFVVAGLCASEKANLLVIANTAPEELAANLYLGAVLPKARGLRSLRSAEAIPVEDGVARLVLPPFATGAYSVF